MNEDKEFEFKKDLAKANIKIPKPKGFEINGEKYKVIKNETKR